MPSYEFTGPYGRTYPESRDAANIPVGQVEPGDTRDLDAPLDGDWRPAEPPPPPAAAGKAKTAPAVPGTDTEAGVTGEEG